MSRMEEDGRPRPVPPTESAQLIRPIAFYLYEIGNLPTVDQLDGLLHSVAGGGSLHGLFEDSRVYFVNFDGDSWDDYQLMCAENYAKYNQADAGLDQNEPESEERDDFEDACCDRYLTFCYLGRRDGYEAFQVAMFRVFKFAYENPPPATIIFSSADKDFTPILVQLKGYGYNLITMSRSEVASAAFREAGLVLYDWGRASRGEGFFPIGF